MYCEKLKRDHNPLIFNSRENATNFLPVQHIHDTNAGMKLLTSKITNGYPFTIWLMLSLLFHSTLGPRAYWLRWGERA
jgi:hypothetical protein